MTYTFTDPDFNSVVLRATDYSLSNGASGTPYNGYCNGATEAFGTSFNMASAGTSRFWAVDSSKLIIQNSASGVGSILAFYGYKPPSWDPFLRIPAAVPSSLCLLTGNFVFSGNNPRNLYKMLNDKESSLVGSLTSGSFITWPGETVSTTPGSPCNGVSGTVVGVNSSLMQISGLTSTSAAAGCVWTGAVSGAQFTASAAPTSVEYVNMIYQGTICDGTACGSVNPANWTLTWAPLFNFNYVSGLGAPYFPTSSTSCMPEAYQATYSGVFSQSTDDSSFTFVLSDNGQSNTSGPGAGTCTDEAGSYNCTGPINVVNFTNGKGCRVWNTMTDQVTGDYSPTGQALNGMANVITGSVTSTQQFSTTAGGLNGELLVQNGSHATTQLYCTQNVTSGLCVTSGINQIRTGVIFGTPDSTDDWVGQTSGAHFTPSGSSPAPTNPPFQYYDVVHDTHQTNSAAIEATSLVQQPDGLISQVQGNTPVTGQTTLTLSNKSVVNIGQQVLIYGLTNTQDMYLNCSAATQPYSCPAWTIVTQTTAIGSSYVVVINDPSSSTYGPLSESGTMAFNGQIINSGVGEYIGSLWQVQGLTINSCPSIDCEGHAADGTVNTYRAKHYTAFTFTNPSLPCTTTGYTPCPPANLEQLLNVSIPVDQHGAYQNAGTSDQTPAGLVSTSVCGQAPGSGTGTGNCSEYTAAYWDEADFLENSVANSGANHCNYSCQTPTVVGSCSSTYTGATGQQATGCAYRIGHTFNTGGNWNFNGQNAIGVNSPDGAWLAYPSDMGLTTGCANGMTNCWSGYIASGPPSLGVHFVQWDGSADLTITVPVGGTVQFCVPGSTAGPSNVYCSTLAEQIVLPTMNNTADTWLNSLGTGCQTVLTMVSATSTTFTGTVASYQSGSYNTTTGCSLGTRPGAYGPVTETTTGLATPVTCTGQSYLPCQRTDINIVNLTSAN
jgi:hypothetical protein